MRKQTVKSILKNARLFTINFWLLLLKKHVSYLLFSDRFIENYNILIPALNDRLPVHLPLPATPLNN